MIRVFGSLAFAAAIALVSGAFAQTAAPVHSDTVNNIPISGAAAAAPTPAAPAGVDNKTNLLGNFQDAVPTMPVLTAPGTPSPRKDCSTATC